MVQPDDEDTYDEAVLPRIGYDVEPINVSGKNHYSINGLPYSMIFIFLLSNLR